MRGITPKFWFGQDLANKWFKEALDENELSLIEQFANSPMFEVVRKFLVAGIYQNGVIKKGASVWPDLNWVFEDSLNQDLSDEEIGERIRAKTQGLVMLQTAFKELDNFKSVEVLEAKDKDPES